MRSSIGWIVMVVSGLLAASTPVVADEPLTVVMLGDSITKGARPGVAENETFAAVLQSRVAVADRQIVVINQGVGGETTAGALARFDAQIVPQQPQIVAIMYGTNDCYVDPGRTESRLSREEFRRNLDELVERVRALGAEPLLMTEPCYAKQSPANGLGEHGNVRLSKYMDVCREVAARRDVVLIDHFAGWTAALAAGEALEEWTTDGYHPNPRGHRDLADRLQRPLELALAERVGGPVNFRVELEEVLSHDDGKYLWYHPRATVYPSAAGDRVVPEPLITLQRHLHVSDHYDGLATMHRQAQGGWTEPRPEPALAWRKNAAGETVAVCDVTPGYHAPTGKVIALGAKILYDEAGNQLTAKPRSNEFAYAVYSPDAHGGHWSEWRIVELPETEAGYHLVTPGCAQWLVEPDGSLLVPLYHKGASGEAYSATVVHCTFDGTTLALAERGTTLELGEVRGLCEPSLARYRGRYYLTLRNDLRGYVTASDDGLHYASIRPWTFDDGGELGSYNTQQHWLAHSGGLFLVYTRRGANNDHIIRNRAPLFMAPIEPETLQVVRASEQIVIPERGGELGNFGATAISPAESWVTVGEGVWSDDARKRGAKGTVFIARVQWLSPNRLRGGSGPAAFVDAVPGGE
ncbi:MAG: hypothetical protein K1X74_21170 [Pirellulales bacterium]|nr:hypothetical protein [Pirellulales bacterium]